MDVSEVFLRNVKGMHEILNRSCVGIAGCGGLGSNAAVALARAGIGHLILADHDTVHSTNLNRQHYFTNDIGRMKVDALSKYLLRINRTIRLSVHANRLNASSAISVFQEADVLIEAFDAAESKKWLIDNWCRRFPLRPIICGNGIAGFGRTESVKITRMSNVIFCGDGVSEMKIGLCAPRVLMVAAMQANIAVSFLMMRSGRDPSEWQSG